MDLRSKKDRILSNAIVVAATELAVIHFSFFLMNLLSDWIMGLLPPVSGTAQAFWYDAVAYGIQVIAAVLIVLYMLLTKRETLRVFRGRGFGKNLCAVGLGLLIGIGLNGIVALFAGLSGDVTFSFSGFSPYLLLILPFVFVQSASEEMLLRGYVPQYMQGRYDKSAIAFVSGVLFLFGHTGNLTFFGFNTVFCLNAFLAGVLFCLFVWVSGNFWIACGVHAGWNYMQTYLLGLPNSGYSTPLGLFRGAAETDSFFYHTVFGNEGSLLTTFVYAGMIGILTLILVRKNAKEE